MPIQFTCPNCLTTLRVKDKFAGQCIDCPKCQAPCVLPELADSSPANEPLERAHTPALRGSSAILDGEGENDSQSLSSRHASGALGQVGPEKILFSCSNCQTSMTAARSSAGRRVTCPSCGTKQRIPEVADDGAKRARRDADTGGSSSSALLSPADTVSARPQSASQTPVYHSPFAGLEGIDIDSSAARTLRPAVQQVMPLGPAPPLRAQRHKMIVATVTGLIVGLIVVVLGVVVTPTFFRERIVPLVREQLPDPWPDQTKIDTSEQELVAIEPAITSGERLASVLQKVTDEETARQREADVLQALTDFVGHADPSQALAQLKVSETFQPRRERMIARVRTFNIEVRDAGRRLAQIPDVAPFFTEAINARIKQDPSGQLAKGLAADAAHHDFGGMFGFDTSLVAPSVVPVQEGPPVPVRAAAPATSDVVRNPIDPAVPRFDDPLATQTPATEAAEEKLPIEETPAEEPPVAGESAAERAAHKQLMADLNSRTRERVRRAATELGTKVPNAHAPEIARVLALLLSDKDDKTRALAATALEQWSNPEIVPQLIKALEGSDQTIHTSLVRALAHTQDRRAALAVGRCLLATGHSTDQRTIVAALTRMGPLGEDAVLSCLPKASSTQVTDLCAALETLGTEKSLRPLRKLSKETTDKLAAETVDKTIATIEARTGAGSEAAEPRKPKPRRPEALQPVEDK